MPRVTLLGAGGQLATALQAVLSDPVVSLGHGDADLQNVAALEAALEAADGQIVINAAAYNLVDRAEAEPQAAFAVNAFGPRTLANWCARRDRTLVHISTDYVFGLDAGRTRPYAETDCPGPLSAYAASKLAGEQFVQAGCPRHFVIRTCGLYGPAARPGKRNFVETMLALAKERDELAVVDDQQCSPTFTYDLARAISSLIATSRYGLYHATNSGGTTWHAFACEIFRQTGTSVRVKAIRSAEFNAPARRPAYSVLDGRKLAAAIGREQRPIADAVREYLAMRAVASQPAPQLP